MKTETAAAPYPYDGTVADRVRWCVANHGNTALLERERYVIHSRRAIVDADCDFHQWGTVWDLRFDGPNGTITVAQHDSYAAAAAEIDERCSAMVQA